MKKTMLRLVNIKRFYLTFYPGNFTMVRMIFDLHVHSNISPCSQMGVPDLIQHAKAKNLDGICITDHDTMKIADVCKEGVQQNGLCVIFGMEYTTSEGDFLIFGPFEDIKQGMTAHDMLKTVEQHGGVAVAAHPFRRKRPLSPHLIDTGYIKFMECVNGRNSFKENKMTYDAYRHQKIAFVGGSDAHTFDELATVTTTIHNRISNRQDFISSIKTGKFSFNLQTLIEQYNC